MKPTLLVALLFRGKLLVTDGLLLGFDLPDADLALGQTLLVVRTVRDSDGQERPAAELCGRK